MYHVITVLALGSERKGRKPWLMKWLRLTLSKEPLANRQRFLNGVSLVFMQGSLVSFSESSAARLCSFFQLLLLEGFWGNTTVVALGFLPHLMRNFVFVSHLLKITNDRVFFEVTVSGLCCFPNAETLWGPTSQGASMPLSKVIIMAWVKTGPAETEPSPRKWILLNSPNHV